MLVLREGDVFRPLPIMVRHRLLEELQRDPLIRPQSREPLATCDDEAGRPRSPTYRKRIHRGLSAAGGCVEARRRPHLLVRAAAQGQLSWSARSHLRQEVRPFTDKQIELVHELRRPGGDRDREHAAAQRAAPAHRRSHRALEQQTATSEVLKVISSSPGELEPVFNAMLENATRICEAKFGMLYCHENGAFRHGVRCTTHRRRLRSVSAIAARFSRVPDGPARSR